jgi:malonyl CoA-acyl carrier protein transacylase
MEREHLQNILMESGVPEEKITELVEDLLREGSRFDEEIKKQHESGVYEPIDMGNGVYLSHLMNKEPDWRKRAAIAAAIVSSNLS